MGLTAGPPGGESRWARLRDRHEWLAHLVRAVNHYIDRNGYQYAASIAYFSALSLIPLLMVLLSTASFVLAGHPNVIIQLHLAIGHAVPPSLQDAANQLADNLLDHRLKIGLFGLAVGLYSGWNWMNTLRDALTAMWELQRPQAPLVLTVLKDLLALVSLGAALLVSFALTAAGGSLGHLVLDRVGLGGSAVARVVVPVLALALSLVANWLVFLWVLLKLPRSRGTIAPRTAGKSALAGSIGFELLKQAGNVYVRALGQSPTGVAFGSVVGLLVFMYLVSRMLMLLASWMFTARLTHWSTEIQPPVASVRPVVRTHAGSASSAARMFGLGALTALAVRWLVVRTQR